jgi:hypothetical protein
MEITDKDSSKSIHYVGRRVETWVKLVVVVGGGSDEVTDGGRRGLQLYYCAYLCVYSQS